MPPGVARLSAGEVTGYAGGMDAVTAALTGLIDYAGLYPPAELPLEDVASRYARYRSGSNAWILGRLIIPADRVEETNRLAAAAGASVHQPWPVSVLVGGGAAAAANAARVSALSGRADAALRVEAIEAVAGSEDEIAAISGAYPASIERFIEIPSEPDPAPLMAALSRAHCAAKIRAGGVTADKFPSTAHVARFFVRAAAARVPLKATAGLHHALRGDYRLTYAPGSATGTMHGFLNLVLAATLLLTGRIDEELTDALLDDDRPEAFKLSGRAGSWLNAVVTYSELSHARATLLRSVGSCSFEEPVEEIERLDFGLKAV